LLLRSVDDRRVVVVDQRDIEVLAVGARFSHGEWRRTQPSAGADDPRRQAAL
jgi:hypothetical protein